MPCYTTTQRPSSATMKPCASVGGSGYRSCEDAGRDELRQPLRQTDVTRIEEDLTRRAFFRALVRMTPAHGEWLRSLVIVALCFPFAALLWTARWRGFLSARRSTMRGTVTTERVKAGSSEP